MGENVSIFIEWKTATNKIIQYDSKCPHGRRPRVKAPVQDELGWFVKIGAAESPNQLANHRLSIAFVRRCRSGGRRGRRMVMMVMVAVVTAVARVARQYLRRAEIDHFNLHVGRVYEYVFGLEIAVENPMLEEI